MKLQYQVCSLEQAKKLKELGVKQKSTWYHQFDQHNASAPQYLSLFHHGQGEEEFWKAGMGAYSDIDISDFSEQYYAAFTVAELGVMLPNGSQIGGAQIVSGRSFHPYEFEGPWFCEANHTIESDKPVMLLFGSTEAQVRAAALIRLLESGKITPEEVNNRLTS